MFPKLDSYVDENGENLPQCQVALSRCPGYDRATLKEHFETAARVLGFAPGRGAKILLKPNLVAGGRDNILACSEAGFIAAAAEWCLDYGCQVRVGDSPAFGSARRVMASCGITAALQGLAVDLVDFNRTKRLKLPCGLSAAIATEALDSDLILNLPRVKAHSLVHVTLALKNYFGVVAGWRKALHHVRFGKEERRFAELLVELPGVLPESFSLVDGITAMHRQGPMGGRAFPLSVIAAGFNPVALDSALMAVIGADPERSLLWRECRRRRLPGVDLAGIDFPLHRPEELVVNDFKLPVTLQPLNFHPARLATGGIKRLCSPLVNRFRQSP